MFMSVDFRKRVIVVQNKQLAFSFQKQTGVHFSHLFWKTKALLLDGYSVLLKHCSNTLFCSLHGCVETIYICSEFEREYGTVLIIFSWMCRGSCIFNLCLSCSESEHPAFTLRRRPSAFR